VKDVPTSTIDFKNNPTFHHVQPKREHSTICGKGYLNVHWIHGHPSRREHSQLLKPPHSAYFLETWKATQLRKFSVL